MRATLEYAEHGDDGPGWYVVPFFGSTKRHFSREQAMENGYEVEPPPEARLRLAKTPEEGPFPSRHKVRAFFAWLAFWVLTWLDKGLRGVANVCWRARWRMGVVAGDRHCPRCGLSLWRGREGCNCELVTPNYAAQFELPEEARVDGRFVRYPVRLRRDLFHWARGHEFFGVGAVEALERDDRLYQRMKKR
jgi:hypothetical protein